MAIESPLQVAIVAYLKSIGVSQRKFAEVTGASETTFGTYNRMTSAMGVDILDKILTAYPGAKQAIIDYLSRNTDENLTEEPKSMDINKLQDELRIAKGMIAFIDEQKTELQRKYYKLESEVDGLKKDKAALEEQLKKAGSAKNKSN